jgi:DNA primase
VAGEEYPLYNVEALFEDTLDIHIAEGEIDAITLHYECGLPAVGWPGATTWKPEHRDVLDDFRRIYVFCDGDSAGSGMGRKIQKELGLKVELITMPEGEDVNSYYVKHGAEAICAMISGESKK